MSRSDYNNDQEVQNSIPKYADTCGVTGCKNDTEFAMIKVSSGRGIEHRVASEVTTTVKVKERSITTMTDNYNFITWFTRCNECLSKGMRDKKAKMRLAGEDKNYC